MSWHHNYMYNIKNILFIMHCKRVAHILYDNCIEPAFGLFYFS